MSNWYIIILYMVILLGLGSAAKVRLTPEYWKDTVNIFNSMDSYWIAFARRLLTPATTTYLPWRRRSEEHDFDSAGMVFQESKVLKHDEVHLRSLPNTNIFIARRVNYITSKKKQLKRKHTSELWGYQGRNV
jgi:hypothetical protein